MFIKPGDPDEKLLAGCAWLEAESEGAGGCYEVMHTVMNRVHSPDFPNTVSGVIFQPNAFSWTRPTDPRHNAEPKPGDPVYAVCVYQAPFVLARDDDPTRGAVFYENPKTATPGGWFERHIKNSPDYEMCATSKHHIFYRKVQR